VIANLRIFGERRDEVPVRDGLVERARLPDVLRLITAEHVVEHVDVIVVRVAQEDVIDLDARRVHLRPRIAFGHAARDTRRTE
jgi:hypothetical protein